MLHRYATKRTSTSIRNFDDDSALRVPKRDFKIAYNNPYFRALIRQLSIDEDGQNSYYTGILNTIAEHCVGSIPMVMGTHPVDAVNDAVEDAWLEWGVNNNIGTAIRMIRRAAARSGIGIGIPYRKLDPEDPIGIGIKVISAKRLVSPRFVGPRERIIDGIEYDDNWDIKKIYVDDGETNKPIEYDAKDIVIWFKHIEEDMHIGYPECGPAFCLFPSVKRYMDAIVRGEEFRASMPMAITLDPTVYPPDTDLGIPADSLEYEPGMIPTLPPGAALTGLNLSSHSEERTAFIRLVIGAAARCVQMPINIALGDSSNHNMATAAYDVQPWVNRVAIDRTDFQPVIRKVFKWWHDRAILASGYLSAQARQNFKYEITYDATFEHPDPNKRAAARATDLASGATTLHQVYTQQGLNPRRQLAREARMLGLTREEYNRAMMAGRYKATFLLENQELVDED